MCGTAMSIVGVCVISRAYKKRGLETNTDGKM